MPRPAAVPIAPVVPDPELLAAILDELHALRDAYERLADDIEALTVRGRLNAEERMQLTILFPATAEVVGTAAYTASDLFGMPQLVPLLAGHTVHTLPRLLLRAAGVTLGGFRVSRIGKDRDGALFVMRSTRDRRPDAL